MATLALAIFGALVGAVAVAVILAYIKNLRYIYRFPNVGFIFPLIGNANQVANLAPEDRAPTVRKLLIAADPKWRKAAAVLGQNPMIWLFHPETAEKILSSNVHITKSLEYKPLFAWLRTGLLLSTGKKWHGRRKMLTPAFHFKILDDSMAIFNKNGDTLADVLLNDGGAGKDVLDLFPYLCRCTLDVIMESAMGRTIDAQNNRASDYSIAVNEILHLITHRQLAPWLYPDFLFALSPSKKKQDRCLEVLQGFTSRVIQEKRKELEERGEEVAEKKSKVAFLDLLLQVRTAEGDALTDEDIQEEVDTFLFEGHDTTGCALSWSLLLIGNHPDVQEKIMSEQREIYGDSAASDVTKEDLTKMRYLEACLKEGLRLYPSVPIMGRELEEDMTVDGETVPKGTTAIVATYLMHRNPTVWDEPDAFRPERFLSENR